MTHSAERASRWSPVATRALALVAVIGAAACRPSEPARQTAPGDPGRGARVFALAGGCGCHTPADGPVGAGGVEVETPFGTFFSTNITNDTRTGIGSWTDAEIDGAIRRGLLRDGSVESPVMPYYAYAGMADDDARDLIAYLRALPPAERANRAARTWLPLPRLAFAAWRLLYGRSPAGPAQAPTAGLERGRYLTAHVGICGDCHTPRTRLGAPDPDRNLAGVARGPRGELVPNITPDPVTGIGTWDDADIVAVLQSGFKPDLDNVQGLMAEMVDGLAGGPGLGKAPVEDLQAIAAYLHTVSPIPNAVRAAGTPH